MWLLKKQKFQTMHMAKVRIQPSHFSLTAHVHWIKTPEVNNL